MLYRDGSSSSSVQHVFDGTSSLGDSVEGIDLVVDHLVEQEEQAEHEMDNAFFLIFEDPSGPFRRAFPDLYTSRQDVAPDLTAVLPEEEEGEEEEEEEKKKKKEVKNMKECDSWSKPCSRMITADGFALKPSPATRFLDAHPGECLLIAIEPTVNRKQLRERHAEEYPGIDFIVGYENGDPAGWALLLSCDQQIVAAMQTLYPSYRFATEEDYFMFYKTGRVGNGGNSAAACMPKKKKPSASLALSRSMRSVEGVLRHLKHLGGVEQAIFVALDVEAAVVRPGGYPLPLEIALVPVVPTPDLLPLHCFLHPGEVTDVKTACSLSCGAVSGSHFIPFRNASFLRSEYTEIAKEINRYLTHDRVVLVNKGTTMDLQALRWVFGAACAAEGSDFRIPHAKEICCFDVDAVLKALAHGKPEGREKARGPVLLEATRSCWYHTRMEEELLDEIMGLVCVHCALHDAMRICNQIHPLLSRDVPLQSF